MSKERSIIGNIFHKNGRALGSMGYFILLMLVFFIILSPPLEHKF